MTKEKAVKGSHFANNAETQTSASENTKEKKNKKPLLISTAALVGIWVVGTIWFYFFFMPNTILNGKDVSNLSKTQVAQEVKKSDSTYTCTISDKDDSLKINAKQIKLDGNAQAYVNDAIDMSQPYLWPYKAFAGQDITLANHVKFDEKDLKSYISDFIAKSQEDPTEPKNASLVFNEKTNKFDIDPEVPGSAFDLELCYKKVAEAIKTYQTTCKLDDSCKKQPTIYKDDEKLAAAQEKANELIAVKIPIKFGETDAYTIDAQDINAFVDLDENLQPSINEDKLNEWIKSELIPSFNTVGSKRTYTRPDGKECSVEGGNYGWKVNSEGTEKKIYEQILNKNESPIQIEVSQKGASFDGLGKCDWGKTYVDVDIEDQHAYFYQDGTLKWDTDIVTGCSSKKHDTPEGVWSINSKMNDMTLRGPKDEKTGEYEWESKVKYWMSFIGGAYGLHDASWRGKFGGNIYTWGGSHGCVNLPSDKAGELFDLVKVGTPVVVH